MDRTIWELLEVTFEFVANSGQELGVAELSLPLITEDDPREYFPFLTPNSSYKTGIWSFYTTTRCWRIE